MSAREELATILETIAKDGLPQPRDLDVALDAILCLFGMSDGEEEYFTTTAEREAMDKWEVYQIHIYYVGDRLHFPTTSVSFYTNDRTSVTAVASGMCAGGEIIRCQEIERVLIGTRGELLYVGFRGEGSTFFEDVSEETSMYETKRLLAETFAKMEKKPDGE